MGLRLESHGTNFDKRAVLREHPIFRVLGPDLIERLASYAHTRTVAAGTTIFARGDAGTCLFAVCAGTVKITNRSLDGKDAVFNLINVGEIFGEIALLDGGPRTADAMAMTDCELMVIDRREFVPLVESRPDIALRLIEVLCGKLRHTSEQIEDMMVLDCPARLDKTVLRLAGNSEFSSQGRVTITQREHGQIIGMA